MPRVAHTCDTTARPTATEMATSPCETSRETSRETSPLPRDAHHRRDLSVHGARGCPVHTRALLTLTCTCTGHLSLRCRGGCEEGTWCMPYHPNPNPNPNPNQGAPTRLPLLRGGASIHNLYTHHRYPRRQPIEVTSWRSLRGHCTSMPSGHCTSVWRFNIECTCAIVRSKVVRW